jgi:acyl carrier protein
MIEKIKLLIRESFEDEIKLNDHDLLFEDYEGWDSLTSMVLIDSINEEFGVDIEIEKINKLSISKIINILK